ncbi:response regulator [Spirosoma endophyticum]|nr:response regulator [Spirosoma endophyticum]
MPAESMLYVVDDEADYRFLVNQVFKRSLPQYAVRFFASGYELYECILTESGSFGSGRKENSLVHPGLILLDLHMPDFSGLQTLTYLKQHLQWRRIPTVIMSSSLSTEEKGACYDAGANSFLNKPTELNQLTETMQSVCRYWLEFNRSPKM